MKNHHLHDLTRIVLTMFLCSPSLVAAQNSEASADTGGNPLFSSHTLLDIRIEAPLSQLMRERPDKDYLDGKLSYTDAAGVAHTFDLKLRTRGKYRNHKKTCTFAPVRLNLRKKQLVGTVFAGQDGFSAQARVFRLKDLAVVEVQGRCSVALPEVRLRPGL